MKCFTFSCRVAFSSFGCCCCCCCCCCCVSFSFALLVNSMTFQSQSEWIQSQSAALSRALVFDIVSSLKPIPSWFEANLRFIPSWVEANLGFTSSWVQSRLISRQFQAELKLIWGSLLAGFNPSLREPCFELRSESNPVESEAGSDLRRIWSQSQANLKLIWSHLDLSWNWIQSSRIWIHLQRIKSNPTWM